MATELTQAQKMKLFYVIGHMMSGNVWDYHNFTDHHYNGAYPAIGILGNSQEHWANFLQGICAMSNPAHYDTSELPSAWFEPLYAWQGEFTELEKNLWVALMSGNPTKCMNSQLLAFIKAMSPDGYLWYNYSIIQEETGFDPAEPYEARALLYHTARMFIMGRASAADARSYTTYVTDLNDINERYKAWYTQNPNFDLEGQKWLAKCNLNYSDLKDWDGVSAPEGTWGLFNGFIPTIGPTVTPDTPYDTSDMSEEEKEELEDELTQDTEVMGDDTGIGSDSTATTPTPSEVTAVYQAGIAMITTNCAGQLLVHTTQGRTILCLQAMGNNVWIPSGTVGGTLGSYSGSGTAGNYYSKFTLPLPENVDALLYDMLVFLNTYQGSWGYTYDSAKYSDPFSSGYTNCSAGIVSMAQAIRPGSPLSQTGMYTGYLAQAGDTLASGSAITPFPYDSAMPGDLILYNPETYDPDFYHVELYLGTAEQGNTSGSEVWNFGDPDGGNPKPVGYASDRIVANHDWRVIRISWDNGS